MATQRSGPRPPIDASDLAASRQVLVSRLFGDSAPSARIARYRLTGRLGRGAMGQVFAAYDETLHRPVAIKVLQPAYALRHPTAKARFLREARALASLSHPNVVAAFDVGEDEGRAFLAMERLDGPTLRGWLQRVPRSAAEIAAVFAGATRGLAAVHAAGLVHRDFKPDNVIVATTGTKVLDFGLTRSEPGSRGGGPQPDASGPLTDPGFAVGTPRYMAPEQVRGHGSVDARSDQFALCVSLYEAFAGRPPFVDTLRWCLDGAPPPAWPKAIPVPLRPTIARGLEADPARRWPSLVPILTVLEGVARPRARRSWVVALGLLALGGASVAVLANTRDPCAREPVPAWTAADRARAEQSLSGAGVDADGVLEHIDRYGDTLSRARAQACRDDAAASVLRCLDARASGVETLARILVAADPVTARNAPGAVASLPPVTRCERGVAAGERAPIDEKRAPAIAALSADLARADAHERLGQFAVALRIARSVTAQAEALDDAWLLAESLTATGRALGPLGHIGQAEAVLERAVWIAMGEGHTTVVADASVEQVANIAYMDGDLERGQQWVDRTRAAIAELDGDPIRAARLELYLGLALHRRGELDAARRHIAAAVDLRRRHLPDHHPEIAVASGALGLVAWEAGDVEDARVSFEAALEDARRSLGPSHYEVGRLIGRLASVSSAQGRLTDAAEQFEQALAIARATTGTESRFVAVLRYNRGNLRRKNGERGGAEADYRAAIEIWARAEGPRGESLVRVTQALAEMLAQAGRREEARRRYRWAAELATEHFGEDDERAVALRAALAALAP